MGTGIQRSIATPVGADTTSGPAGQKVPGKPVRRKDLTAIMAAHNIPYVAQVSPSHWNDVVTKVKKALDCGGPAFIKAIAPCDRGWRIPVEDGIEIARLAVDTCYWPLYEVVNGEWRLTYKPKEKKPLVEFLKPQGRFKHLFTPENEHILKEMQDQVDRDWNALLKRCGEA